MTRFESRLIKIRPIAYLIEKSKTFSPPGFEGMPLYDVLRYFREQTERIGFNSRASGISFNILMALPAGLIFLCTLVPFLPKAVEFEKELLKALNDVIKNARTYELLADIIHDFFSNSRNGLLSFSFAAAIFFSSNAMMGIMRTFDRSYYEERSSRLFAKRWTAIKLTSLLVLLVFTTILLLATQGTVKSFLLDNLHLNTPVVRAFIQFVRWFLIIILNYLTVAFIYRLAPAVTNRWPLLSPGAVLATLLTITTTWLFSEWVNNFGQFNKVYGSLGTVLIIMNLVYINSLVLLIGFELNVCITAVKTGKKHDDNGRQAQGKEAGIQRDKQEE